MTSIVEEAVQTPSPGTSALLTNRGRKCVPVQILGPNPSFVGAPLRIDHAGWGRWEHMGRKLGRALIHKVAPCLPRTL